MYSKNMQYPSHLSAAPVDLHSRLVLSKAQKVMGLHIASQWQENVRSSQHVFGTQQTS